LDIRPIQALVLSSPALDAGLNPWQKMVLLLLPRWLPDLRVGNGLDPAYLSHNPKVVADYLADHLVHDRISLRLGRFIADAGAATLAAAPNWRVPTLLLFAGADHLVNPHGSRRFAQAAPLGCLTSVCFESMFHELFNENDNRPVLSALKCWLDQRF
jgi:alpha-beta hydrolase superfamily lysophospholipase